MGWTPGGIPQGTGCIPGGGGEQHNMRSEIEVTSPVIRTFIGQNTLS